MHISLEAITCNACKYDARIIMTHLKQNQEEWKIRRCMGINTMFVDFLELQGYIYTR